jgi:mercuric ion transport protein
MANEAKSNKLLGIGIVGTAVMAVCCFTPALTVLLAAVGLSFIVGAWMDFVLLPALVCFLGLAVFALVSRGKATSQTGEEPS